MPKHPENEELLHQIFPNIASQLRGALGNIHSALNRIAPPEQREQDAQLDTSAALLYQSYYRILRVVNNLTDAAGPWKTAMWWGSAGTCAGGAETWPGCASRRWRSNATCPATSWRSTGRIWSGCC